MSDEWGPNEWMVMWQSAPAYVRARGCETSAATDESERPYELDDSNPDKEPADELAPDPPATPARLRKPKPKWHALPPQRSASTHGSASTHSGASAHSSTPPIDAQDLHNLGIRIRGMAADLAASMCEWLHLIERFDRESGWAGVGIASCAAWLSWTCSVSPATAREYVRIARALPFLPQVDAAFAAGRLSYSKVRVLVSVAAEVDEATLLRQAEVQTVSQLERTVRAFRRGDGWSHEKARRASWRWDEDGMLVVSARLPPDEGALLIAALENSAPPAVDRQETGMTGSDPRDVARADMLMALAERALAAGPTDSSGDDRHLVVVHADLGQLQDEPQSADSGAEAATDAAVAAPGTAAAAPGTATATAVAAPEPTRLPGPRCHLENGPGLTREVARRIACDAALVAVIHHVGAGEPLRLGRKTRTISPAQRRALRVRDGGCRFPGCHRLTHLNAHHVRPWSLFGPTDLDNLVLLCRLHHKLVHEGGYSVSIGSVSTDTRESTSVRAGAVTFHDPRGARVSHQPLPGSTGIRPELVQVLDPAGLLPSWRGEPFHLSETVGVLATAASGGV